MSSGLAPLSVKSISKSKTSLMGFARTREQALSRPVVLRDGSIKTFLARLNNLNDIIAITLRGHASIQSYYAISRRLGI